MKLMITADDYGLSDAVTDGIIKCARDGLLTQTGLMTNLEGSAYAAERIKEVAHICLGQDINLVAGKPISNPKLIPSMVQSNGYFKNSKLHIEQDKTDPEHIVYEEALIEIENQVLKFIELIGHKPAYLSGHSYGTKATTKAMKVIAEKYGLILSGEFYEQMNLASGLDTAPWNKTDRPKYFPYEEQAARSPLTMFKEGKLIYLDEALKNNGIAHIHTHCGYVDADLIERSSYTLIRCKEAEFICSKELKTWVQNNNVELVSINDLIGK